MPYKMVTDIGKLCGRLAGAAVKHRARISNGLALMWRDRLEEGQEFPDVFQLQTFVGDDLHEIHDELSQAARKLGTELAEDRKGRDLRDGALVETRDELFAARSLFDAMYGPGGSDAMFEEQNSFVQVDPAAVYEQAVVVHGNLVDPEFERPPLRVDVGVDLEKVALRIERPMRELGQALDDLHLSTHGSNASLEAKEDALAKLRKRAGLGARLLEALYAYAGHEGIAARTRRSSHRGGGVGDGIEIPEPFLPEPFLPEPANDELALLPGEPAQNEAPNPETDEPSEEIAA